MNVLTRIRARHGATFAAVTLTGALVLTGCSSVAPAATSNASAAATDGASASAKPSSEHEEAFNALKNVATTQSTTSKGAFAVKAEKVSVTGDMSSKTGDKFASVDMTMKVDSADLKLDKVAFSAVADNTGSVVYLKVNGLQSTVDQVMKSTGGDAASIESVKPAITKIDGKFVKMDMKELESLSGQPVGSSSTACSADLQKLAADPQTMQEIADVLEGSDAISAKRGGSEKIAGEESQGFTFEVDLAKAKNVGAELEKTEFGTAFVKCQEAQGVKPDATAKEPAMDDMPKDLVTKFDVFIGADTKNINKMTFEMSSKDEDVSVTGEFTLGYDKVTVAEPAADQVVPLKDVIDSVAPGMYDTLTKQTAKPAAQ